METLINNTKIVIETLNQNNLQANPELKVSSVQEACAKSLFGSLIKIRNLANHMKKQNKEYKNSKSIGEKLKTTCLMFFVSSLSYDLQDFKF